jgi:hypothetical protein
LKKRIKISVVFLLLVSFVWLFANQAMYTHSHLLNGGQVVTHAHPYTPDKNSHSPFQSHKHQPSVAFFLDLISSLNVDSFVPTSVFLAFLSILALVPILHAKFSFQECHSFGISRAPPQLS